MQPGGYTFQIWDSKVIGSLRQEEYGDGIVNKIFADNIEDLAGKLAVAGLDSKDSLVKTVNEFNEAVKTFRAENPSIKWNPAVKDGMSRLRSRSSVIQKIEN